MKNIKLYELEETYHNEESSLEYPTVSYTKDTEKVWYIPEPPHVIAKHMTTSEEQGVEMLGLDDYIPLLSKLVIDDVEIIPSSRYYTFSTVGEHTIQMWFKTEEVTSCYAMFAGGYDTLTSIDLSNFNTKNVTNMAALFFNCYALSSVTFGGKFTTENVTSIGAMFDNCYALETLDVSSFNTSKVVDMWNIFDWCGVKELDLTNWDTRAVENASRVFNYTPNLTSITFGDLCTFENATTMSYMFASCSGLTSLDLSNFDTSNVTNVSYMFNNCSGLPSLDVSNFDTSKVTNMSDMFAQCTSLTSLDLSNFDTSQVTNMSDMFYNCSGLTSLTLTSDISHIPTNQLKSAFSGTLSSLTIYHASVCDLAWYMCQKVSTELQNATFVPALKSDWELTYITSTISPTSTTTSYKLIDANVGIMESMTINGSAITPTSAYTFSEVGDYTIEYGIIKEITKSCSNLFFECSGLTSLDLSNFDTSNATDMERMCSGCYSLTSVTFGDNFDTSNVTDMRYMFNNCSGLTSLDLSNFDTSNVTNMYRMFYGCSGLTSLDLSNFDTSNVTDMGYMFNGCSGLTSLDLSNFNTSNVTNMSYMFNNCRSLTSLDLSNFNTSNVTVMHGMFQDCSGLTSVTFGDNFNTSKVTEMNRMFYYCRSLTSLDLSNFDTSNVTSMYYMFQGCRGLTSVTFGDNFDTSKVTQMDDMFAFCGALTSIDLSNFNTSKVTSMYEMFYGCSGLTSLDLSNFDTSKVSGMIRMFSGCTSLTSVTFGSQADVSKVTSSYSKMFDGITTTGTLYYPSTYATAWNNLLVTQQLSTKFPSTWVAVPIDYENGETVPTV